MGTLNEKESFGEISVLLQVPFLCTLIAGSEVELAIIEDKHILGICITFILLMCHFVSF